MIEQWLDSWPGKLSAVAAGLGLLWRWLTAYPLLLIERRKTAALAELDRQKQAHLDYLEGEVDRLRRLVASPGSSTGSPAPTPISATTPTSPPAPGPSTGSMT